MMSTVPLAMLVMLGGVASVKLRMVGWIENGLTPLRVSFDRYLTSEASVQHSWGRLGADVHLDLHGALHWWFGEAVWQAAQDRLGIVRRSVREGVGVDDVCWVQCRRGRGERCGSCQSVPAW